MPVSPETSNVADASAGLDKYGARVGSIKNRINTLLGSRKLEPGKVGPLRRLLDFDFELSKRLESKTLGSERRAKYIASALEDWSTWVAKFEKGAVTIPKETGVRLRKLRHEIEQAEARVDNLTGDSRCKRGEAADARKLKEKLRALHARLAKNPGQTELESVSSSFTDLQKEVLRVDENFKTRKTLHRMGVKRYMHNVFDRHSLETILSINKGWRAKESHKIASELGLDEESAISLAMALGWPVLSESLEWWRKQYPNIRVGEMTDVTDLSFEGTPSARDAESRIIQEGLSKGKRVFAVPLYGGRGSMRKWDRVGDSIAVDSSGKRELTTSPHGVVAAWLCSYGEHDTHNIGYDELGAAWSGSIEGMPVKTAHAIFLHLGLSQDDTYILMIRDPAVIQKDVEEFKVRLESVLKNGSAAVRRFSQMHPDAIENIRMQIHPHIEDEVVLASLRRDRA